MVYYSCNLITCLRSEHEDSTLWGDRRRCQLLTWKCLYSFPHPQRVLTLPFASVSLHLLTFYTSQWGLNVSFATAARSAFIWLFREEADKKEPGLPLTAFDQTVQVKTITTNGNRLWILSKWHIEWTLIFWLHFRWRQGGNPDDAHTYTHSQTHTPPKWEKVLRLEDALFMLTKSLYSAHSSTASSSSLRHPTIFHRPPHLSSLKSNSSSRLVAQIKPNCLTIG